MAKAKKESVIQEDSVLEATLKKAVAEKLPIEDMPLNSIREYRLYNEEARKLNHKLKMCRYPIKPCPIELHPKQRVVFRSNDQPHNPQKVHLSNDLIHYDEKLIPGKAYDLPECIIHHLATRENPQWDWFDNPDGSRETRVKSKKPRFSLTPVYQEQ